MVSIDLLAEVEDAGLNASSVPQQRWMDGWLVRCSAGKAKRARCINPLAASRRSLDDQLAACRELYAQAGLPLLLRLTPFSQPADLHRQLDARGWHRFDETLVMVRPALGAGTAGQEPGAEALGLQAEPAGPAAFAEAAGRLRGSSEREVAAHAERLRLSAVPYEGRVWRDRGVPVACGQFAREGRWAGLYDIVVAQPRRGNGIATALCASLLAEAAAQGARAAYLQVGADNAAALAVYRRLGFAEGYRYHYRCADPADAH
jgi:ribosomal protein S18 acetylase RimI-like enzyme